jgi:hypothetical protein
MFMVTPVSMVDQNIGRRAGRQQCRLPLLGRHVRDHRRHVRAGGLSNFLGRLVEQRAVTTIDDQGDAGLREREGARPPKPLTRCADDRRPPANS